MSQYLSLALPFKILIIARNEANTHFLTGGPKKNVKIIKQNRILSSFGLLFSPSMLKSQLPSNVHCAHLLLFLSGVSFQLIAYIGKNKHRGRNRKILSSIVEVMEVSECEEDFHISDGNLSEDGQVELNAYVSPIAALDRAQDIVRGGEALVITDENIVRVV